MYIAWFSLGYQGSKCIPLTSAEAMNVLKSNVLETQIYYQEEGTKLAILLPFEYEQGSLRLISDLGGLNHLLFFFFWWELGLIMSWFTWIILRIVGLIYCVMLSIFLQGWIGSYAVKEVEFWVRFPCSLSKFVPFQTVLLSSSFLA